MISSPPSLAHVSRAIAWFVALASALVAPRATAQAVHHVGLGVGYAHHAVLDSAATSLTYAGHLATTSLVYQGDSARWRWTGRLAGSFGHMEGSQHPARTIRFESQHPDGSIESVSVPMHSPVTTGGAQLHVERVTPVRRVDLLVGGNLGFGVSYVRGFVAPGLMQLLTIGPTLGVRVSLPPRQQLELAAQTVLAAWATRMPYDQTVSAPGHTPYQGLVARGSGLRSLRQMQTLALDAAYQRDVGARGTVRANVGLFWLHDTRPRPLRVLDVSCELRVSVRIGANT